MAGDSLTQSPLLGLGITPDSQRINRGEAAVYLVTVENRGTAPQTQALEIRGLPAGWCKVEFDTQRLAFPGEQRTATLTVSPANDAPYGQHGFEVWCKSGTVESGMSASIDLVSVEGQPVAAAAGLQTAPEVSLAPALVVWRGEGHAEDRLILRVRNVGDEEAEYTVSLDGLETGWYALPSSVRVAGRQALETEIRLHPPARARQGDYPFRVAVTLDGPSRLSAEASGWLSLVGPSGRTAEVAPPPQSTAPAPSAPPPVPVSIVEVNLAPRSTFRFGPEDVSAQAIVTIQNKSRLVERYNLSLEGIPPDWFGLAISDVRLEAGASTQVPLRLTPRTGPGWPAGDYEFRLRIVPQSAPESAAELGGLVSITGVANFDARLNPVQAEGREETFTLTLTNTGDLALSVTLEASDPEKRCRFRLPVPRELQPGQETFLPVKVGARRSGIVGARETFDFQVKVTPEGAPPSAAKSYDARFVHKPAIGFRPIFIVGFFCALVAFVFLVVVLATPAVSSAGTWIGCQLDNNYRFSARDPTGTLKEECGGHPRKDELEKWERQPRSLMPVTDEHFALDRYLSSADPHLSVAGRPQIQPLGIWS